MTWIRVIPAEDAVGDLAAVYERQDKRAGTIGLPFEGLTHNGPALLRLMEFTGVARFGASPLGRLHQEMIATYVSALNGCLF